MKFPFPSILMGTLGDKVGNWLLVWYQFFSSGVFWWDHPDFCEVCILGPWWVQTLKQRASSHLLKDNFNVDFTKHYLRSSTLKIWNRYKHRLCLKMWLGVSVQEAFHKKETAGRGKLLTYWELFKQELGEYKMNPREQLVAVGFSFKRVVFIMLGRLLKNCHKIGLPNEEMVD